MPPDDTLPNYEQVLFDAVATSFAEEGTIEPTAEAFAERLERAAEGAIPEMVEYTANAMLAHAPEHLAVARAEREAFRAALRTMWGEALDGLEYLIDAYYDLGREILLAEGRAGRLASDACLAALGRLHARACRTAREVLHLIEQGLPDGALARCRTLHELAIVSLVLAEHGEDLAIRYTRHAAVRAEWAMRDFNPHHEALGWEPISEAELQAAAAHVAALVEDYGPRFRHDYGWADGVIPPAVPGHKLAVQDLERAVGLTKFRPFGDWSSASVHAGPQGLHSLGVPLAAPREVRYVGGSTSGLADPGQHAALSIGHLTGALVRHLRRLDLGLDLIIRAGAVATLVPRCQTRFIEANTAVEETTRQNLEAAAGEWRVLGVLDRMPSAGPVG